MHGITQPAPARVNGTPVTSQVSIGLDPGTGPDTHTDTRSGQRTACRTVPDRGPDPGTGRTRTRRRGPDPGPRHHPDAGLGDPPPRRPVDLAGPHPVRRPDDHSRAEGIGKSLTLAWLSAQITRGVLPGRFLGEPRPVIYAATEDSWSHTIGPRLYAAGADLDMVYRVDIEDDGALDQLTLPRDCSALAVEIRRLGVALLPPIRCCR